eukprot:8047430-Pyramimonas_sp.AAC.1
MRTSSTWCLVRASSSSRRSCGSSVTRPSIYGARVTTRRSVVFAPIWIAASNRISYAIRWGSEIKV